jgi:hypothetical protein
VSRPGREHGQMRSDHRHLRAGGRQMPVDHQVEHNTVLVTGKFEKRPKSWKSKKAETESISPERLTKVKY